MLSNLQLAQDQRQDSNPGLADGKSTTVVQCNCYPPGRLLPTAPCSTRGHPSHPLDHPGRQSAAGGLQASNFKLPANGFLSRVFFFPWREADKAVPLGSCCLGLLKTLGGLRPTQEAGRCRLQSEPLTWVPPLTKGSVGAPKFP